MPEIPYQRADVVLCFDGFKDASLYFDRVLPLNMGRMRGDPEVGDILVGYPEEVPSAALSHLVDGIEGNSKTYSHATRIIEFTAERWADFARKAQPYASLWASRSGKRDEGEVRLQYEKLRTAYLSNEEVAGHPPVRAIVHDYAKALGFESFCVAVPDGKSSAAANTDPALTLSQLQLVDTAFADWRQIIELRKDKQSHQRLIRLRLFMHANYAGKSFAFIEDDLARRIEEYGTAARKHGFRTALSSLTLLLNAKDLHCAMGAGLVAGLFGGPLVGIGAGVAVEVGKVAVHIAERAHEMREWWAGHELAYIMEARIALSGPSEA
jgi:hypothetical protein